MILNKHCTACFLDISLTWFSGTASSWIVPNWQSAFYYKAHILILWCSPLNIFNFLSRKSRTLPLNASSSRKFNSRVLTNCRFAVRQPSPFTSFSFIYSSYSPRGSYSSSNGGSNSEPSGKAPLEVFPIPKYIHYFNKQHLRRKTGYEGDHLLSFTVNDLFSVMNSIINVTGLMEVIEGSRL